MDLLKEVRNYKIIAALRGVPAEKMVPVAEALYEGGIRMLEITFNQSSETKLQDTAKAIEDIKAALGDKLLVGAGTVMTLDDLEACYKAGAGYMLSPNLDLEVLARAKELGMGTIPGCMSPSEVAEAYKHGADLIKLFPCDVLGMGYIKALKAPISQIPLVAMGGVNEKNLMEYLSVVDGVGVGSGITKKDLIAAGDYEGLKKQAQLYTSQL